MLRLPSRKPYRSRTCLLPTVILLSISAITTLLFHQVHVFLSTTKTIAGHNLDPTPWHLFPPKTFENERPEERAYKIIRCPYLTCRYSSTDELSQQQNHSFSNSTAPKCPKFFTSIYHDLQPWALTKIRKSHLEESQKYASFRVVIFGGKLYVDLYYACVQSRAMFTIWGLLQLLRRYPGMVPDVDLMFDCMDRPTINQTDYQAMPLPLFRYCTNPDHYDIPFPDWSFWGWPETHLQPWDVEFQDIKKGSQRPSWKRKVPRAYWKGNPDVSSPVREELMACNHSRKWGAQIFRQDWDEETKRGFQESKLSSQCSYRYKIYAEGYAWSVSLKYILSCGSVAMIISPEYEDFFSRGLVPKENFWPIDRVDLCQSIKTAVDWLNSHPVEAEALGRRGQEFIETLNMDRVYDYMFHLISEYSKMQEFKPMPPPTAFEMCAESLLCLADEEQRQYLKKSSVSPSTTPPCSLN